MGSFLHTITHFQEPQKTEIGKQPGTGCIRLEPTWKVKSIDGKENQTEMGIEDYTGPSPSSFSTAGQGDCLRPGACGKAESRVEPLGRQLSFSCDPEAWEREHLGSSVGVTGFGGLAGRHSR